MKRLWGILLIVVLVVPVLGAGCGPSPEEEQYREAFNSGMEYCNQGKEYISDTDTLLRLGNLDEAALAASRAQGKFRSAAGDFYEAYEIAAEHGIGLDAYESPQQQRTPATTPLTIEVGDANSKAWNNWTLSLDLENLSGELVDRIVEAKEEIEEIVEGKEEMALPTSVLDFIGMLLSLLPLLL